MVGVQEKGPYVSREVGAKLVQDFGSPLYVYNETIIRERYQDLVRAFSGWKNTNLLYAAKANTNPHILQVLREEGAGLDCVSMYEVEFGLLARFSADQMLFTVNNMSDEEMRYAHERGLRLNIDSLSRLERYGQEYPGNDVCLRLTPGVSAGHHAKVRTGHNGCKFGIQFGELDAVQEIAARHRLRIVGLHEHTGSGIKDMDKAMQSIESLIENARRFPNLEFLDFGGGFPIPYRPEEERVDLARFGEEVIGKFSSFCESYGKSLELRFEPGRYIVAEAGIMLCTVTTLRERGDKAIIGVDTGFNHLVRPVMYDSYHHIVNLTGSGPQRTYNIYGNICESGDKFGENRTMTQVREGDILAILDTGAYGFAMASQYNSRPLPAEVMIRGNEPLLIRRRQTFEDIVSSIPLGT